MIRSYLKRALICIAGLALYGFGNLISIKAGDAGTNAWNTLALGISGVTEVSFGAATLLVSCVIILFDVIGRGKLGFGSLLNFLLIPFFSDFFLTVLAAFPAAPNGVWGVVYTLIAQLILSFALVLYMSAALGCGPRDTMMVIIGQKMPKAPIGVVKFLLESAALVVGIVMGAPFGLGTLLVMVLQASMFQFACAVCRYEPRNANHENFMDTIQRFRNK